MRVVVIGDGLVGARTAAILERRGGCDVSLVAGNSSSAAAAPGADAGVVVLATTADHQVELAGELVAAGRSVVTTTGDQRAVKALWGLDEAARRSASSVAVGAAYAPGVSSLLASWLVRLFDTVSTITTARFGTGGPACAREHHRSMGEMAAEVRDGRLRPMIAGTGRQLIWFPEPVGGADCYRAGLAEPFLLHRYFPEVPRIQALQAATRRDRLTSRLPMLRSPHAEGLVGALWVEVRGTIGGAVEHRVMGVTGAQATGAAAMAAASATVVVAGPAPSGVWAAPALDDPAEILRMVAEDVSLWAYDGSTSTPGSGEIPPVHAARKWTLPR